MMRGSRSRSPSEVVMSSSAAMATSASALPPPSSVTSALPPFHGLGRKVAAKSLQARLYNLRKVKR